MQTPEKIKERTSYYSNVLDLCHLILHLIIFEPKIVLKLVLQTCLTRKLSQILYEKHRRVKQQYGLNHEKKKSKLSDCSFSYGIKKITKEKQTKLKD